ncbi:MAG: HAD-IIA family hydrolase [Clostridia bacterium]|nr:HAD-IIA family hydrolase [Clostridia bacterium]
MNSEENLKKVSATRALLLDLDGTVYLENELIGDVKNTLKYMRDIGVKIGYLTNNSSRTDDEYVEKLTKMGIFDERDIFYSSLDATIDFLKTNYPDKTVYPLATKKVTAVLETAGIKLSENADIVLLTFDKELNYEKMVKANELIVKGATYISTHPDNTCPAKDVFIPDAGSFISLFKTSSGREPDIIVGKPFTTMADMLVKILNLSRDKITMVGDRLHTDIAFGVNADFNTVLVLSGETTLDMAKVNPIKPTLILDDINCLKNIIK